MHNSIDYSGEMKMAENQEVVNAVLNSAQEADGKKKLSCAQAFKIAAEFNIPIIEIGRICNQQNIKIRNCQLGCFQ